jgi:hypothetical protein
VSNILAWHKARNLLNINAPSRSLENWPDAFAVGELAMLQYPNSPPDALAVAKSLNVNIERGELVTVICTYEATKSPQRRSRGSSYLNNGPTEARRQSVATESRDYPAIERAALAAWFQSKDETPSVHLRAWLGAEWQVAQAPETATDRPGGKVDAKKDTIRAILTAIKKLDPEFSPKAMPGQKADFFVLCQGYDPKAFKTITLGTFDDYLSDLCKFGRGARPTGYFREIAPQIGVKCIKAD